jgi:hypothetical protein
MWRRQNADEAIAAMKRGTSLRILLGAAAQLRSLLPKPPSVLGVTIPRWPCEDEALVDCREACHTVTAKRLRQASAHVHARAPDPDRGKTGRDEQALGVDRGRRGPAPTTIQLAGSVR